MKINLDLDNTILFNLLRYTLDTSSRYFFYCLELWSSEIFWCKQFGKTIPKSAFRVGLIDLFLLVSADLRRFFFIFIDGQHSWYSSQRHHVCRMYRLPGYADDGNHGFFLRHVSFINRFIYPWLRRWWQSPSFPAWRGFVLSIYLCNYIYIYIYNF